MVGWSWAVVGCDWPVFRWTSGPIIWSLSMSRSNPPPNKKNKHLLTCVQPTQIERPIGKSPCTHDGQYMTDPIPKGSYAMEMFTAPVNRTDFRYCSAQLIEPFGSESYEPEANFMLARFKVNNIVYGWQSVNIMWQYFLTTIQAISIEQYHCPQINTKTFTNKLSFMGNITVGCSMNSERWEMIAVKQSVRGAV